MSWMSQGGGGEKGKNQKAEILPAVEVPKILPYENLMSFLKTIDVGELRDLQTLLTELSTECVSARWSGDVMKRPG